MKVFTASQIRAGDVFTIEHEPIQSIDLMERAANTCAEWLLNNTEEKQSYSIFCGTGNNGGDGLAIARILHDHGREVQVFIVLYSQKYSADFSINKKRIEQSAPGLLQYIHSQKDWPKLPKDTLIVDALFGTGLNRPLSGLTEEIVQEINRLPNKVVAIDMPSGLQAEKNPCDSPIVKAAHTLSFEFYKLAFLFSENAVYTGKIHLLSIHLHPDYIQQTETSYHLITKELVASKLIKRNDFSHKGIYGHALIIAGSYGKTGAAVLATKAALHAGAGLVSSYVPKGCYTIMQISVPEAMCICDVKSNYLSYCGPEIGNFTPIGVGPGIGTNEETHHFLKTLLTYQTTPMVIDADALNLISQDNALLPFITKGKTLLSVVPKNSILTPHPKEFSRLFGETTDSYERLQLQIEKSKALQITIILKGHHTCITTPSGEIWFNMTGNAGMATGGSGDVLTGLLTGLLAQKYEPSVAAIIGVWLHGKSGDLALDSTSMESLTASNLIQNLGSAFKSIYE